MQCFMVCNSKSHHLRLNEFIGEPQTSTTSSIGLMISFSYQFSGELTQY